MGNKLNLTDSEKRDITKYLEAGKPLPDKYRFLLFNTDREIELLWNGKTEEVENMVLPFQAIEHIDEPRSEEKITSQATLFDTSGRQIKGWSNKLIWGDNKLILPSLKNGPLRKQIEAEGGLKLVYIDPPFDVGADFSMNIEIGEENFTKKPSVIEEIAYRDTWGKGADSFIAMIYERLKLIHGLLADDGSIYVHCDWRLNSYMRLIMDEIFGKNNFINEIVWKRRGGKTSPDTNRLENVVDYLIWYSKNSTKIINFQFTTADSEDYLKTQFKYIDEKGRRYRLSPLNAPAPRPTLRYEFMGYKPHPNGWSVSKETLQRYYDEGKLVFPKNNNGRVNRKQYLDEWPGYAIGSLWTDISLVSPSSSERLDYPTQKPESLIKRVIETSTNKGDLVADFFCGSGTTLAVAEKLGRKWIGTDLGKFSIHTTRKRMIGVQRELKKDGKDFRAFEILNIGKYEREKFLGTNENLREEERRIQKENKEKEFVKLILSAYKAEPIDSFNLFVGKKRDRLIAVGSIDNPVTNGLVEKIVSECQEKKITKVDVLGFDYEMGIDFEATKKFGIDIQFKVIPRYTT
jgi:adenine-specific DNA-methyltransferase